MWLTVRVRGECSSATKWREIVGRNGSTQHFEPFANQIAIIDGNNHTVETISPLVWLFPPAIPLCSSDISPVEMLTIFFSVNTQGYPVVHTPRRLPVTWHFRFYPVSHEILGLLWEPQR